MTRQIDILDFFPLRDDLDQTVDFLEQQLVFYLANYV